jgi:ankyrin repeat protein
MYFKITNGNQSRFQLKTGLNIQDDKPLKSKGSISLSGFGLSFTNLDNLHYFYDREDCIIPVMVPHDAKIINGFYGIEIWLSDKIILGDRFPLYDLKTIKKFNLKITYSYISGVCKRGKVDILKWWKNSGYQLLYEESALEYASQYGHVNVLEWWKNSGLELKYDTYALDWASRSGQVEVLKWWKNSGLELKYTENALNWASRNGHVNVLEWWKNSCLELKYNKQALKYASQNGHINILEWWKNSGLIGQI